MKSKAISLIGAIGTAILASSCCTIPLILAFLGLGSLGASSFLARHRVILLVVPFIFLGVAYYFTYRKRVEPSEACCPEEASTKSRVSKLVLWVVTGVVVGLTVFAYLETAPTTQIFQECCFVEHAPK